MTDMNLQGFLAYHKGNAYGLVITDAGKVLTDKELRAYARWGLLHGYKLLSELPEFETIKELNHDEIVAIDRNYLNGWVRVTYRNNKQLWKGKHLALTIALKKER